METADGCREVVSDTKTNIVLVVGTWGIGILHKHRAQVPQAYSLPLRRVPTLPTRQAAARQRG